MCVNVTLFPGSAPWCRSRERGREMCACCSLGRVQHFETPWTVARQASPSMGVSRQGYWSGLPFPPPRALPDPGIKSAAPALQVDSIPPWCVWKATSHTLHPTLCTWERTQGPWPPAGTLTPTPHRATEAAAPPCRSTPSLSLSGHQVGKGRGRGWSWTQHASPSLSGHSHSC